MDKLLVNCDMGEWDALHLDNIDEQLMQFIDVSNIACGGHAGSKETIRSTIKLAHQYGVKVGAHPSYNDRENFGRQYMDIDPQDLEHMLKTQIDLFLSICNEEGVDPFHIKPHGALYHACNFRKIESQVFINLMSKKYRDLVLFVFPDSSLEATANHAGLKTMRESFVDRRYNTDLTLMSRSRSKQALITDSEEARMQFDNLSQGKIQIPSGEFTSLASDTTCIHGDNPSALEILKNIKSDGSK